MPSQSSERTLLEIDVKRGIVHHVEAVAESAESRVKKGKSQAVASFALSLSPPPPLPPSLFLHVHTAFCSCAVTATTTSLTAAISGVLAGQEFR